MMANASAITVPADSLKPLSAVQPSNLWCTPEHWLNKPPCRVGYLIYLSRRWRQVAKICQKHIAGCRRIRKKAH